MLTHVYDLSQPYPRPPAHFRAHTLISDPPPYSNSISFVTTCFHAFPTSVDCLRTPQRVANRPHAFSRQSAPFFLPIFRLFSSFLIIFICFFLIVFTHFFYHIRVLLRTSTPPQPLSRPTAHFWAAPLIFTHFQLFSSFLTFLNHF